MVTNTCSGNKADSAPENLCDGLFRFAAMVRGSKEPFHGHWSVVTSVYSVLLRLLRLLFTSNAVEGLGVFHNIGTLGQRDLTFAVHLFTDACKRAYVPHIQCHLPCRSLVATGSAALA